MLVRLWDEDDCVIPDAFKPTRCRTSSNLASSKSLNGSRFVRIVPEKRTGSCGITAIFDRSIFRPTLVISIPSIVMEPLLSSTILSNDTIRVDFPAPVLPTTPTLLLGGISMSSPFKTKGRPGLYLSLAELKTIFPSDGQVYFKLESEGKLCGASLWIRQYCRIRSVETIFASRSELIRTDQFKDWVTERANEIDSPANPAKVGFPPCVPCCRTAHKHALEMISVPTISRRIASQHCAVQVKK
mmetsp:Transcript_27578/g.34120  ORF Transcript_27578/g.34120 Transcript_27578/m.34120 type:complete len:243 (+) Transcript_27578:556-1284(+)